MKKLYSLIAVSTSFILISGCTSNGKNGSIGSLAASSALTHCIDEVMLFNDFKDTDNFEKAEFIISAPSKTDIKMFSNLIKKELKGDTDAINKYLDNLLNNQETFIKTGQFKLSRTDGKSGSCHYMFFDDNNGHLKKNLLYYKTETDKHTSPLSFSKTITATSPKDYLFSFMKKNHGLSYKDIVIRYTYEPSSNQDNLTALKEQVFKQEFKLQNMNTVKPKFAALSASDLAEKVVSQVYFPDYVPENPIYLTPITNIKQVQALGNYEASNKAILMMDAFNAERYVDPDTGIALRNDVLEQLKREYGVGFENSTDASITFTKDITETLRIKGDEYFEQEKNQALE